MCFLPITILVRLNTYTNCALIYILYLHPEVWLVGYTSCIYFIEMFDWWETGWSMLSCHRFSCTRYWQYLPDMNCLMYGTLLRHFPPSYDVSTHGLISWKKNRLVLLPRTSFISYIHTKIRSVSCLATDSTRYVYGRGWNTYGLLCGGSILGLCL